MVKPKIVLLIFVSGKIVLTGAKVREEIYQAFEVGKFQKEQPYTNVAGNLSRVE